MSVYNIRYIKFFLKKLGVGKTGGRPRPQPSTASGNDDLFDNSCNLYNE